MKLCSCSTKRKVSEGKRGTGDPVSDLVDTEAFSADSHVVKKAKRRKVKSEAVY